MGNSPAEYTLNLYRGCSFSESWIWRNPPKFTGTPINLTGCSGKLEIRKYPGGPVIATMSTTNKKMVLGGVAGTITINLTYAEVFKLNVGNYVYDVKLTMADGSKPPLVQGQAIVWDTVTQ